MDSSDLGYHRVNETATPSPQSSLGYHRGNETETPSPQSSLGHHRYHETASPQGEPLPAGWRLNSVTMENFKSYATRVTIGPLADRPFLCIVGENGSGKSNFMDAISFVMGERTASLRVKRLDELIHGASIGQSVSGTAEVSASMVKMNSTRRGRERLEEVKFTRIIRGANCEYLIDSKGVTRQAYVNKLKQLGISSKGSRQNFLVFQGAVESVATKDAKERAQLIEEISGSLEFKAAYEEAQEAVAKTEKKQELAFAKKKAILVERQGVKMDRNVARRYQDLLDDFTKKEVEVALFQLCHNKKERTTMNAKKSGLQKTIEKLSDEKKDLEEKERQLKQEKASLVNGISAKDNEVGNWEKDRNSKMPALSAIVAKRRHLEKKIENAKKSRNQATNAVSHQQDDIRELRKQLRDLEQKKREFEELHGFTELLTGSNVDLRDSQMLEYLELKKKAVQSANEQLNELRVLHDEKNAKEQVYNSKDRDKARLQGQLEVVDLEGKETKKSVDKILENVREMKTALKEKESQEDALRKKTEHNEKRAVELLKRLTDLEAQIDKGMMYKEEIKRREKKAEVLAQLKSQFPGVIGRVGDLFKPVHDRYSLAVAKVIGGQEDLIVVDTLATTRKCLKYMMEERIEPESFLSLSFVKTFKLKTGLRQFKKDNVHLLYDVLQFSKDVEVAILHCTRSTVVCHSAEIAHLVASGQFCGEPTDAVTLEGTLYSANGAISGGSADLSKRTEVRRWTGSQICQLAEETSTCKADLSKVRANWRDAADLKELQIAIDGHKSRLKFAETTLASYIAAHRAKMTEKKKIEGELNDLEPEWTKARSALLQINTKIKELEGEVNVKTDAVFANFCNQVGITNIRVFEDRDVRAHEARNREREELEKQIRLKTSQIQAELDQEKECEATVTRWEKIVSEIERNLDTCRREEEAIKIDLDRINENFRHVKEEVDEAKKAINAKATQISEVRKEMEGMTKKIDAKKKALNVVVNGLHQLIMKRNEVFKNCQLKGINLPLVGGSLTSMDFDFMANAATANADDPVEVDFESLPPELKDIAVNAVGETMSKLEQELVALDKEITSFQAPKLNIDEKWKNINSRIHDQQKELDQCCLETREAKKAFKAVQKQRYEAFMACYQVVSSNLDSIYKDLTQHRSAQAVLDLQNTEEPYLGGVSYDCVAPGKKFLSMNSMSGGEKTLAALALLFAIHSFEPAPFFVLDEIDAALDLTNIGKVVSYISRNAVKTQFIVITLKEEFYQNATAFLGITPSPQSSACVRSEAYLVDLSNYVTP